MFQMPAHGSVENEAFEIPAFLDQVFELISMGYPDDVLFDDRPVVQNFCNVMAGGPNQLDAPRKRSMVRPRTAKCGKERMVHVDDSSRILADECGGKDLHVTGENDEIGF